MSAPGSGLPDGFVVRLAHGSRLVAPGVIIGGFPTRVIRLTPAATGLLHDGAVRVADPRSRALAAHLLAAGVADPDADLLPDVALDRLTVVIPVKDRPRQLARLLAGLPPDLARVIVVDDGSDGPRATADVARAAGLELLALTKNIGPAGARNAGLAKVETEFVAFVDSDVVLTDGALERLLRHFADPGVAMAAPRVQGLDVATPNIITRYENARSSLDLGHRPAAVRPRTPLSWVSSTCLVVRVAALGDGFDPAMRVGEDVDLVWRLADAGWRVRYEPAAVVLHDHRTTLRSWLGRKFFYGTGAAPLARRHPNDIAPAILPPWAAVMLVALGLQRRWSLPVAAALCAVAVVRTRKTIGPMPHRTRVSLRLVGQGVLAAIAQGAALLLRHWWPLTAVAMAFSRRARRAAAAAAVLDTVWEMTRLAPGLDPLRFALARRLDDAAYGAGVWWSAMRDRTLTPLLPRFTIGSRRAASGGRRASALGSRP